MRVRCRPFTVFLAKRIEKQQKYSKSMRTNSKKFEKRKESLQKYGKEEKMEIGCCTSTDGTEKLQAVHFILSSVYKSNLKLKPIQVSTDLL